MRRDKASTFEEEKTQKIKDELDFVYGGAVPSLTKVNHWVVRTKVVVGGRRSLVNEEHSGRPND